MVVSVPAFTTGRGLTVTFTSSVLKHVPSVAVTVYKVVMAGDAFGLDLLGLLNPPTGVQL